MSRDDFFPDILEEHQGTIISLYNGRIRPNWRIRSRGIEPAGSQLTPSPTDNRSEQDCGPGYCHLLDLPREIRDIIHAIVTQDAFEGTSTETDSVSISTQSRSTKGTRALGEDIVKTFSYIFI